MNPLRVVMIGPALTQNGGMASMEKLILKHAPPDHDVQLIVSHDEGSFLYRIQIFAVCLIRYIYKLTFRPVDIVYIHISERGSIARKSIVAVIGLLFMKPVVMHAHAGSFPENFEKLPKILRFALVGIFNRCRAFIALSEIWKRFYVETCNVLPERIYVLTNPVEVPKSIVDRETRKRPVTKILYCGKIRHAKGTFDLIRAFGDLPLSLRQSTELVIAGDGEVEAARDLAEKLNVKEQVQLPGWVDEIHREKLLDEADIFTLPSYFEGLPMSILEAMSAGLPIVSTNVGGIPDIVADRHNGFLVDAGDISALSDRLKTLIEDVELRISYGRQSRLDSMQFDIKPYWVKLRDVFSAARQSRKPITPFVDSQMNAK